MATCTYLTVTSIDIGAAHFAVYVERVPRRLFDEWKKSPARGPDAPGQCLWHVVWDLRSDHRGQIADGGEYHLRTPRPVEREDMCKDDEKTEKHMYPSLEESDSRIPWTHRHLLWNLSRHHYLWAQSDQILIEKQLNCNPRAIRLETVCTTYFCLFCPAGVRVDSFPARYKTGLWGGGPVGKNQKGARKMWARNQALALCGRRNDAGLAAWFGRPCTKKDDLADAMLMVQAWKHQQSLPQSHPAHWSRFTRASGRN